MTDQFADPKNVSCAILTEIQGVMGLGRYHWAQRLVRSLFGSPAHRLAGLLCRLDQDIARCGFSAAVKELLGWFVRAVRVDSPQVIPPEGPLLVVSNHPGAYDLLMLVASLARDDLKIISSDIAIFRHLPALAPHFIPITDDPYRRMAAFRAALRHLLDGKALLIFPRGDVEVDPALSPDAAQGIDRWSPSLELLLRKAPQTRPVVAIVSGIISSRWFNHPFLRLWKKTEQRQKVAEIFQVAEQLVLSRKPLLTPSVSFALPPTFSQAGESTEAPGRLMQALTQTAQAQLAAISR